ncbi:protein enabled-like [Cydia strobilella]|uniref:protein enabled-like n=1 Tax=Cydia strobilella TaxID=1100964 RepID=UPI003007ED56
MVYPPPGPPPPPYYGPPHPWGPHHHCPPPPHMYPPPPHDGGYPPGQYPPPPHDGGYPPGQYPPPPQPYYVPGTMMVPVPVPPAQDPANNATYITNYIYHGENQASSSVPAIVDEVRVVEDSGEHEWIPTTATMANQLTGRAVVGGHEGWDGSPLWVIRAWHAGDLIPGKLSIRHCAATVVHDGKEIPVQNIEVLCSKPESLRWVPASTGNVPPGAIPGGRTSSGETLYVGRARYQLSVTPGKVHPSHSSCYIGFSGNEVAHKMYDVLCRAS